MTEFENFQKMMSETTEAESPRTVSAKVQTKESLMAALTSTVTEKASRKASLKADPRWKEPGKMMAWLKAGRKSKGPVRTMAYLTVRWNSAVY
jgi:hypothetical protein